MVTITLWPLYPRGDEVKDLRGDLYVEIKKKFTTIFESRTLVIQSIASYFID
jgi:hypothetical protein